MASLTSRSPRTDRVVGNYLRRELYPHTQAARARLDAAAIVGGRIRSLADLQAVEPVELGEVGDGRDYMVRPTRRELMRSAKPTMRLRAVWASTWGRWASFLSSFEPQYRPVHFFTADDVPMGAAAADLVRLAGLGANWMRTLGVSTADTIALVGGASSRVEPWQLSGGTRRAGIPLVVVEEPTAARRHNVTVVAGADDAVLDALADGVWPALRLALVFGPSARETAARLTKLDASGVAVRRAWAPTGTRAVWFECRGGAPQGWHTTPAAEYVELDDDGEVVWTGIGWAGTVFLRLRTDVHADRVVPGRCEACGHEGPRVYATPVRPALTRWLRNDERIADVRVTSDGVDVLPARSGVNARLAKEVKSAFPDQQVSVKTKKTWSHS